MSRNLADYSVQEKIKVFDDIYVAAKAYVEAPRNRAELGDELIKATVRIVQEEQNLIGSKMDAQEMAQTVENAFDYYESFLEDVDFFAPSTEQVMQKRQFLEEIKQENMLSDVQQFRLEQLDAVFNAQYERIAAAVREYFDFALDGENFYWLQA